MTPEIKAALCIIAGLLFCFYGYRVQKLLISIVWFIIGYQLANLAGSYFINDSNILLIVQIVVGIILASIGFKLEKLAIFITVSYLAYQTLESYMYLINQTKEITFMIQGGISLLIGAISVLCIKPILIVITSISGANLIKESIPTFITLQSNILFIIFIVLIVLGIIYQLKDN